MLPPRIDQATVRSAIGSYADQEQTIEQRGAVYKELLGFVVGKGRRPDLKLPHGADQPFDWLFDQLSSRTGEGRV